MNLQKKCGSSCRFNPQSDKISTMKRHSVVSGLGSKGQKKKRLGDNVYGGFESVRKKGGFT